MPERLSICLERSIPHPLPWVFRAWTQTAMLKAWFRLAPGDHVLTAFTELKPGGQYHLHLARQRGRERHYRGVYREVELERRLCFTWHAYGMSDFETRVELDFAPDGRGCLLVLLHDELRDRKMLEEYQRGWACGLDSLEQELPGIRQRH